MCSHERTSSCVSIEMCSVAKCRLSVGGSSCDRIPCMYGDSTSCRNNNSSNISNTSGSGDGTSETTPPNPTSWSRCCRLKYTRWTLMCALALTILLGAASPTQGSVVGSCWRRLADGMCGKLIKSAVTQEECCSGREMRSWTTDLKAHPQLHLSVDHDDHLHHQLYNNTVIFDKPLCKPCAATCSGVRCGEDRKCILRRGSPRCVCNPQCPLENKAPVCGSDGRTYASECHLLKRSCRKKKRLTVSHYGPCQTCSGVRCGGGKQCVMDERLVPECVRCPTKCPDPDPQSRPICGQDAKIYESSCHLKLAQCQQGRVIFRAYKGHCKEHATCADVRCWVGQRCLTDPITQQPQCTSCGALESCQASSQKVCGSDGRTYTSWCALRHEACRSGRSIVTVPHQKCTKEAKDKKCNRNRDKKHKEKDSKNEREPKHNMDSAEKEEEVIMKTHQYEKMSKGPVAIILSENIKLTNVIGITKDDSINSNNSSSTKKEKKSEKRQRKRKRKGCKKNKRKHRRGRKSKKNTE